MRKEYDVYAKIKAKEEQDSKVRAERDEQRRKEAEAKKAAEAAAVPKPTKAPEPAKPVETKIVEEKKEAEQGGNGKTIVRDEKKAPPGNGGSTDKYVWTQTLDEVFILKDTKIWQYILVTTYKKNSKIHGGAPDDINNFS